MNPALDTTTPLQKLQTDFFGLNSFRSTMRSIPEELNEDNCHGHHHHQPT